MVTMPITPGFVSSIFYLEANSQVFESDISRVTQRAELGGQRWRLTFTLPPMTVKQAAPWIAFFMQCKGQVSTFSAYDPDWKRNLGAWTGTPLVKGASQTGNSLLIDGCTANVTGWAKAGDYFNCNSRLYRLTQDANTNGSGETTLYFEGPIYSAPADNAPITCNPATATMRLIDDGQGSWMSNKNRIYEQRTFSAVEAI